MNNAFISSFFFLFRIHFCLKLFGYVGKRLDKEISKLMTSRTGAQTITMHILPDILRSKGDQTINRVSK